MKIREGNMWEAFDEADLFCITTNSTLTKNHRLVMGAGIAKEAALRFPDLPLRAGQRVLEAGPTYGLIVLDKIALFQTKEEWWKPARSDLIYRAARMLERWALEHPHLEAHLNFPGIGHGRLTEKEVLPLLAALPDNITVWKRTQSMIMQRSQVKPRGLR